MLNKPKDYYKLWFLNTQEQNAFDENALSLNLFHNFKTALLPLC